MAYKIIRFYQNGESRVIKRNLTKDEAKEHCSNAETSSKTCSERTRKAEGEQRGAWFDGFTEQ